jgi:hypothetical protein
MRALHTWLYQRWPVLVMPKIGMTFSSFAQGMHETASKPISQKQDVWKCTPRTPYEFSTTYLQYVRFAALALPEKACTCNAKGWQESFTLLVLKCSKASHLLSRNRMYEKGLSRTLREF